MNRKIVSSTASASITQRADCSIARLGIVSAMASNVASLSCLLQWINQARLVVDSLRDGASLDADLRELLKSRSIPFGLAEWGQPETDGMGVLLTQQMVDLKEVTESLDAAAYGEVRRHG